LSLPQFVAKNFIMLFATREVIIPISVKSLQKPAATTDVAGNKITVSKIVIVSYHPRRAD